MLYPMTAVQAIIALILLFGIFFAHTTLSSLISLVGFVIFATLATRGILRIIRDNRRPVSNGNVYNESRYAPDYYQGTSPSPTQSTVHTGIPQDSYIAPTYPSSYGTSNVPPQQSYNPTPPLNGYSVNETATPQPYNPGQTNMVVPGVIGGAAGFAVGAALAHTYDNSRGTETTTPQAAPAGVADTFMLPPETTAPADTATHASATTEPSMLAPIQADDIPDTTSEPTPSADPVQTAPMLDPIQADDLPEPDPAQDQWNSLTLTPVEAEKTPDPAPYESPTTDFSDTSSSDDQSTSFD